MTETVPPRDSAQPGIEALANLDVLPRLPLAVEPTPLVRLAGLERTLAAELGREVPRIFAKLDAYTGFGLGGNKVRKLEYVLAPERLEGITHLVTAGGVQSNHCRVTAAAAARLGLGCVLVVNGEAPAHPRGNARLHRMFGAEVLTVADREARTATMERVAEDIAAAGGQALSIPIGASTPLGALGYVRAAREFTGQIGATGSGVLGPEAADPGALDSGVTRLGRVTVMHSTSSGGTLAGLLAGIAMSGADIRLLGVSADTPAPEMVECAREIGTGAGLRLGWSGSLDSVSLEVTDGYVGDGYGIPTREAERATSLFARHAGIVLDPTYTSKAAAGLIDWIRTGRIDPSETVVFWHTGGWPAAV